MVQKLIFLYLSWTKKCNFISKCKKKELIKACAFFSGEAKNENVGGGGGYFSDKISNEIYYNNGFGYFSSVNKLGLPNVSGIADPFDVDGDGDMDMIITQDGM